MKKSNMRTQLQVPVKGTVLIILFHLYGSKTALFEGNLFWVGH